MGAVRRYLLGRHTTKISIIPCTINASGVITLGTEYSLRGGRCRGLQIRPRNATEMVMGVDDVLENHESLYDGYTVEVSELLVQKTGAGTGVTAYEPILPALYYGGSDVFKITLAKGGKEWNVYGLRESLSDGVDGQGQQIATMSFLPKNVNLDASGTPSIVYGDAA